MESVLKSWQQDLGRRVAAACSVALFLAAFPADGRAEDSPARSSETFAVALPELEGPLTLGIFSETGEAVRLLHRDAAVESLPAGLNGLILSWDGLDDGGRHLPDGTYRARGLVHGPLRCTALPFREQSPLMPTSMSDSPVKDLLPVIPLIETPRTRAGTRTLKWLAADDALYEKRPWMVLGITLNHGTATLSANGLPLLDIPSSGDAEEALLAQGNEPGSVMVLLRGSGTTTCHTVTGLDRLVPLEAGKLILPSGAFLSGGERQDSRP